VELNFKKKITVPKQPKTVKPTTLEKIKQAKALTNTAYSFTKDQVHKLIEVSSSLGEELMEKVGSTKFGQRLKASDSYAKVAVVGQSTIRATAGLIDGLIEALFVLAREFSDTTTQIVNKKFGENVGEATKEGFDALANLGSIYQSYKEDVVVKEEALEGHANKPYLEKRHITPNPISVTPY